MRIKLHTLFSSQVPRISLTCEVRFDRPKLNFDFICGEILDADFRYVHGEATRCGDGGKADMWLDHGKFPFLSRNYPKLSCCVRLLTMCGPAVLWDCVAVTCVSFGVCFGCGALP